MSCRVTLIDARGWLVTAYVPCDSTFHAMVLIGAKYPGCQVLEVEAKEAAHA